MDYYREGDTYRIIEKGIGDQLQEKGIAYLMNQHEISSVKELKNFS